MKLALLLLALAHAKFIKSSLVISKDQPWAYLTKFGMDVGKGSWMIKLKLTKGNKVYNAPVRYPIRLQIYRDDYWADRHYTADCQERFSPRYHTSEIKIAADGSWTSAFAGSFEEQSSPHFWIFVLADCENRLGDFAKLKAEFTVLDANDGHLSIEDVGLLKLYFWLAVVFLGALGANLYQSYRRFVYRDEFDLQLLVLNLAICLQFVSLILEISSLTAFQSSGKELSAFEFLGRASEELAQLAVLVLLIAIAEGWTITFVDLPNIELYVAVFIFVGLGKLVLVGIGRLSKDSSDVYSDYENLSGAFLVLLRLGLFGWFWVNISALGAKATGKIKLFINKLAMVGSLYFLSQPAVVFVSFGISPYMRHWVIVASSVAIQMTAMLGLSLMFTRQKSEYNKVRATTHDLPGIKLN